jgi:hypothetical protein
MGEASCRRHWGRNTSRQHFDDPVRLYFGDANGSGNLALLEAIAIPAWASSSATGLGD